MKKEEALNQLERQLKDRQDDIRRGVNVSESRRAVSMIKRKMSAIKRLG